MMRMATRTLMVLLLQVPILRAGDDSATTGDQLAKRLGGLGALQIIREASRIEGVRVDQGIFELTERGKMFEIDGKLVEQARGLFADRGIYTMWRWGCNNAKFKLVFHHEKLADLEMLICLDCSELTVKWEETRGDDDPCKRIGFRPGRAKVRQWLIDAFPDHKDIVEMVRGEQLLIKELEKSPWTARMPRSLVPLWIQDERPTAPAVDLAPYRVALRKEFPEAAPCILALLAWYGSGEREWSSGFPAYERDAEDLLLDFTTVELLAAMQSDPLTKAQTEGAARLLSGSRFLEKRFDDRALIPGSLKKRLLEHALSNPSEENRKDAKKAFEAQ